MTSRSCLVICFGLAVVWGAGCTSDRKGEPPTATVKGIVKMDGKLIPTGEIAFGVPGFPPSVLPIKDGEYSGKAPVGKNKVEVFVHVDGPPSRHNPNEPTKKNVVPDRYWGPETTLEATVTADGANEFDFSIASR